MKRQIGFPGTGHASDQHVLDPLIFAKTKITIASVGWIQHMAERIGAETGIGRWWLQKNLFFVIFAQPLIQMHINQIVSKFTVSAFPG